MKSFALFTFLVPLVPSAIALTIDTPLGVVQCEPTLFTWEDGTPPYYLSLIPANQPSAAAIKSFPVQSGTSYSWNVDLPSGTSFTIALKDSTGLQAFSDSVTVGSNPDSSCLNSAVTETNSGSMESSSMGSSSMGTSTTTDTSFATGTSVTGFASGTTSRSVVAASSTSTSKSGAAAVSTSSNAFGIAALVGLMGMVVFGGLLNRFDHMA